LPGRVRLSWPFSRVEIQDSRFENIRLDELMSTPFYAGSQIPVVSGMASQADVIPQSSQYFSTRMEDGIVIAGADLHRRYRGGQLAVHFPATQLV
jgi:hypothetical protein